MKNKISLQTLIFINQCEEPHKLIESIQIEHYSKFILVDADLERINRVAIFLENKGKRVFILNKVRELSVFTRKEGKIRVNESFTVLSCK